MPDDHSANILASGVVAVGGTADGHIETRGDQDWFAVELVAGRTDTIDLRGNGTGDGTLGDPYLHGIHDGEGNLISGTTNNDGGAGYNSRVTDTSPAADGGREGATELEDITDLAGPRFPRGALEGGADATDRARCRLCDLRSDDPPGAG